MSTARFILAICPVALGCALLITANEPREATAQWVESGVHDASLLFLPRAETTTDHNT